jgi:signal transduction histidine kinase
MKSTEAVTDDETPNSNTGWLGSYAWAIEQMPSPAYCCSTSGMVMCFNPAAVRIWGGAPYGGANARWHGFVALHDMSGQLVSGEAWPCMGAASGPIPPPAEFFATSGDGQIRRVVIHAKPILDTSNVVIGVICCLTDISDKRRLQERIHDVASTRGKFLDMLAHELRNPLAPIMSAAGLLQHASADPFFTKVGSVVERQARQLARFIADLLDASRLNCACVLPVNRRMCVQDDILVMAVDAVEPVMHGRRQRLVVDISEEASHALDCDPERIAQALGNVLSNASAFTPDGEAFHLRAYVAKDILVLEVADAGTGIAAVDLQHVFEPFQRRAVAPGRAAAGAGLGLTIAKGVCEAHGGSIEIRSAGLGEGTTVSLRLPVVQCV